MAFSTSPSGKNSGQTVSRCSAKAALTHNPQPNDWGWGWGWGFAAAFAANDVQTDREGDAVPITSAVMSSHPYDPVPSPLPHYNRLTNMSFHSLNHETGCPKRSAGAAVLRHKKGGQWEYT